jgi:myxalamid-type polyketide synthase MxaE and MxaD
LTRALDLDCFVLFSSTTALLGARGLAHYAAASCFLDALAHVRRAEGLPALSINWGLWESMRIFSPAEQAAIIAHGLRPMPVAAALDALSQLLHEGAVQQTVADVDWDRLLPAYEAKRKRPFLAAVRAERPPDPAVPAPAAPALAARLAAVTPGQRHELLVDHVRAEVAWVMGYPEDRPIDPRRGLFDMGMDSLTAAQLRHRLETALDRELPATAVYNHPTIQALATYLGSLSELAPPETPASENGDLLARFDEELAAVDALLERG